jgi:hypothetical protein
MPKVIAQEIIDLCFIKAMFGISADNDFNTFITGIIAEQALILEGRIGSENYSATTSPLKDYVKFAEKNLSAAEVVNRRINYILRTVAGAGQEIDTLNERKQREAYLSAVEEYIGRIAAGVTSDTGSGFASGTITTDHFTVSA